MFDVTRQAYSSMADRKEYTGKDIQVVKIDDSIYDAVDLSLAVFRQNLQDAAILARDFTRTMVTNQLPETIAYIIHYGRSFDGNQLRGDEKTFPDDYALGPVAAADSDEVATHLWRDGFMPEWINVTVSHGDECHTHINLECCGRYSATAKLMYHVQEGRPPFHVLGPAMPPGYDRKSGDKFDLHWRK